MIQFDEHIFQMGASTHQLDMAWALSPPKRMKNQGFGHQKTMGI